MICFAYIMRTKYKSLRTIRILLLVAKEIGGRQRKVKDSIGYLLKNVGVEVYNAVQRTES